MKSLQPKSTHWIDQAPLQIKRTAELTATRSDIWSLLADNSSWPSWFPGFKTCEFVSDAPHGVGSVRQLHQDHFRVTEEILTWEPERAWAMTVTAINLGVLAGMAEQVFLSDSQAAAEADMTTITWHIGIETSAWARPIQRPLAAKATKSLEQALINLDLLASKEPA